MAHIIPPYYHHAKPVIFCFGRDFTPALSASAAHPAARPHDLPHIRPAGLEPVHRCSAAGRPPPFGLCAERIRTAVPAARSAADQAGTLLLADGQPLGVIEDSATLLNAVNAVESSASAVSGTDYYLPLRLQARPVRTAAPLLTQEELEHNLITASGDLDTLAVISVDGKQIAIAADTDGAQAALDQIKAAYTTAADENVHFLQTVRVDKAVAPAALAETDSALYDTLSQCLDVTATRAVTYTEQIPFDTVTQENENQDQTYRETVQQGCAGTAQVTAEIETVDGEERTRTILARTVLRQATDEIV